MDSTSPPGGDKRRGGEEAARAKRDGRSEKEATLDKRRKIKKGTEKPAERTMEKGRGSAMRTREIERGLKDTISEQERERSAARVRKELDLLDASQARRTECNAIRR